MESSHLGAASLINESLIVFGSFMNSRVGLRCKRFRRVAEKWRFRAQLTEGKELRTKHELVRFVNRSESLRYILKQYGVTVENTEESSTRSRFDDPNCEEKHVGVPSSIIDDSQMNTTELSASLHQEKYRETVSSADYPSGQKHHNLLHLNTGALFTFLLPVLGLCIVFIIVTLHRRMSRNSKNSTGRTTSRGHHHGSKTTRWKTVLSDWNEQLGADENDSQPDDREVPEEVKEAYSRVELEYQRFLSECGVTES